MSNFIIRENKEIINIGDVVTCSPPQNSNIEFFKKVIRIEKKEEEVVLYGNKLFDNLEDAIVSKKEASFIWLKHVSNIHYGTKETCEEVSIGNSNNLEISVGDIVVIKDIFNLSYQLQINELLKEKGKFYVSGYLDDFKPLEKREDESISGIIPVDYIEDIFSQAPKKNDINGKMVKEGDIIRFKNRMGARLYKRVLKIEESDNIIKLWGPEPTKYKKDCRNGGEINGFVFSNLVEVC